MNLIACVKKFFRGVLFGVPATVTLIDSFGYIAKVDGVSMQVISLKNIIQNKELFGCFPFRTS